MNVDQAKEARARLTEIDPGFVAGIDGLKSLFGARLTALQVGDIILGNIGEAVQRWEEAPPFAVYRRPEEVIAEWKEIKANTTGSRGGAAKRTAGRKR